LRVVAVAVRFRITHLSDVFLLTEDEALQTEQPLARCFQEDDGSAWEMNEVHELCGFDDMSDAIQQLEGEKGEQKAGKEAA
jgi:hypothetical protein